MTSFAHKVGNKLVDQAAGGIAKGIWQMIGVQIALAVAGLLLSVVTGHPEIIIVLMFVVICFCLGLMVGSQYTIRHMPDTRKIEKQKILCSGELVVLSAYYGNDDVWEDVTDRLNEKIKSGMRRIAVTNTNIVGGNENDPYRNRVKRLVGAFAYRWSIGVMDTQEGTEQVFPPP